MIARKNNVFGKNGPNRNYFPTFKKISLNIDDNIINEVTTLVKNYSKNDIDQGIKVNQSSDFTIDYLNKGYKQIYLQDSVIVDSENNKEENFFKWNSLAPLTEKFITLNFGQVYRTRIAITPPNFVGEWHIDTDPSVMARIQIIIKGNTNTGLEFIRRNEKSYCAFETSNIYFINVGWSHRLINDNDFEKISIIFGIHSLNIIDKI